MKKLLLGVASGAALVLFVLNAHVVRDSGGTFVVFKEKMTVEDTYVDSRELRLGELLDLPPAVRDELARRKLEAGRAKLQELGESLGGG